MARKSQGTSKFGFKGPKCEHCSWGPARDHEYTLPFGIEIHLGNTCDQCIVCFEGAVRALCKMHGADAFYPLVKWMEMEGYSFILTEP